jgi:uncharacterized membrane protein
MHPLSTLGLAPKVAGALVYLLSPLGETTLLLLQKENCFVRA